MWEEDVTESAMTLCDFVVKKGNDTYVNPLMKQGQVLIFQ
jgi:hypothetical protein